MKFTELKYCPFCENEEFFTHNFVISGTNEFYERFDGKDAEDNSQMYDGLSWNYGDRCYCSKCRKYIGNRNTNSLSREAEKALKERENNE